MPTPTTIPVRSGGTPFLASTLLALGTLFALPVQAATLATVETEAMSLPAGASVVADAAASNGQAVRFTQNGSATYSLNVNGSTNQIVVKARGVKCKSSWPAVTVKLDNTTAVNAVPAATTSWTNYTSTTNFSLASGQHTLTVTASNVDACGRYLFVDVSTLNGSPPAPTVTLTASPNLITPGSSSTLAWSSTNATSCTASGAWSGAQSVNGNATVTPAATSTYTLACTGAGGTRTVNTIVTVDSLNSGVAMPTGSVTSGGHTWQPLFAEDFIVDSAYGSWSKPCGSNLIAYTGAGNTQWQAAPECTTDANPQFPIPYRAFGMNTRDGLLDIWLYADNNIMARGAAIWPILDNATLNRDQTYGRIEFRAKQTAPLPYHMQNIQLRPQNNSDLACAQSVFPKGLMNATTVNYVARYGCGTAQDQGGSNVDRLQWHTYTQEWMPGQRNYYIDGVLVGSSTNQVSDQPARWQLQIDSNGACGMLGLSCPGEGHLLVDWVVLYGY
ncbi:MAG: abfB [Moraxellaceae bacterium]|nr:abfB [Moraxellaceae bacterium]